MHQETLTLNSHSTPHTRHHEPGNDLVRSLTVEVVEDDRAFLSLRPAWDELVEKSSGDIFQTFDWLSLWWKYYGEHPARTLHVLVVRHETGIAAICPLFSEVEGFLGLPLRKRLRMMGCGVSGNGSSALLSGFGPSDYLDAILDPSYRAEIVRILIEHIQTERQRYDEVEFLNIPERGFLSNALLPELRKQGIPHRTQPTDICPRMTTPSDADDFVRKLKPEIRRRINQVRRAALELYSIETVQSRGELKAALDNLIALHQRRWNQLGYPGLFADRRFSLFQEEVLQSFFDQGRIWCKTVELDGSCVAVRIGFKFNSTIYDFLSGFDYDSPASKRRPGIALLFSMIQDAISSGAHAVDFLRGDEEYKFDFADGVARNSLIVIHGARNPGAVRSSLSRAIAMARLVLAALRKEWTLLTIQYHVHGGIRCLPRYVRFRTQRARIRLSRETSARQEAQRKP